MPTAGGRRRPECMRLVRSVQRWPAAGAGVSAAGQCRTIGKKVRGVSERIGEGARIETTVDLPVGSSADRPVIPAGTSGVVRRVYTDALGGYQVEFGAAGHLTSAIVYANQLIAEAQKGSPADPDPVPAPKPSAGAPGVTEHRTVSPQPRPVPKPKPADVRP